MSLNLDFFLYLCTKGGVVLKERFSEKGINKIAFEKASLDQQMSSLLRPYAIFFSTNKSDKMGRNLGGLFFY